MRLRVFVAIQVSGVQPLADDALVAPDLGVDEGSAIVPRRWLPRDSAMLGDMLYGSVTPTAQAEDSGDRRWDGDLDIGSELLDQAIGNSSAIIGAVRRFLRLSACRNQRE